MHKKEERKKHEPYYVMVTTDQALIHSQPTMRKINPRRTKVYMKEIDRRK